MTGTPKAFHTSGGRAAMHQHLMGGSRDSRQLRNRLVLEKLNGREL